MNYLVLDVETTTINEGHPFDKRNKLCIISYATATESGWVKVEYDDDPYASQLAYIQRLVDQCDVLIGFNFKFDLHWLRRYGITWEGKRVWCCQLAEFMLDRQRNPYPSLDETGNRYGLGGKSGIEVIELWDAGVDTRDIPLGLLTSYAVRDSELTKGVFLKQYERCLDKGRTFYNLVCLHNEDLLVLEEMEWNGLLLDQEACAAKEVEVEAELKALTTQLQEFFEVGDWVNFGSTKQLSALLFGGKITKEWREEIGVFKTGAKIGLPRYAVKQEEHEFQGVVQPLKRAKLMGGGWSTGEDHLRSIKSRGKTKLVLDAILKRSELEKLRDSYLQGLPKLSATMGWTDNFLHGQINQCVARTGRSSSSKPNMQNNPASVDLLFRSRFGNDGQLIAFDAKGLEWVGAAFLSQDPVAIAEIKAGVDQHEMNRLNFGLPNRLVAKVFVFRLLYGGTPYAFTMDPEFFWVSDREDFWEDVKDKFYAKYKAIDRMHTEWFKQAVEEGLYISPCGREYVFTNDSGGDWKFLRPVILNYPVQGLGHDLMAIARVSLFKRLKPLGLKSKLVNTIHDSMVLDIFNEECYTISNVVEQVFNDIPKNFEKLFGKPFNLPMKAESKRLDGMPILV